MQSVGWRGIWRMALATALAGALASCGVRYQAPIAEQGVVLDRSPPEIVTVSDDAPTRYGGGATSPAAAPGVAAPATGRGAAGKLHVVGRGDTLYSIAFQYDLDHRSLASANGLTPPYTIYVGQQINLDTSRSVDNSAAPAGPSATIGTAVQNNSVAQAQPAAGNVRGVSRQPLSASRQQEPQWEWPLRGNLVRNFQASSGNDKGVDISAVAGQPVHAAAAGEVVYAGNGIQGSGNLIIIRHSDRFLSAYAHNRSLLVSEGDAVRAGDPVAEAGQDANGVPMLHFEIRLDGKPVDPLRYLPR